MNRRRQGLLSRRQHLRASHQLALSTHDRQLGPVVVVHRVEGQDHPDLAAHLCELDHRFDLIGLDARDEVDLLQVGQAPRRVDLREPDAVLVRNRHACLRHVVDHLGRDRAHRVGEAVAGTEIQLAHDDAESLRAPPRFDSLFRRPELPDLVDRSLERALEGELGPDLHATALPRYAFSSSAMSSFFILSIACMAASELPDFESLSIWPSTSGTICHETPNRSFSHPHGPSSPPPSVSLVQYLSTSCCVLHMTISEIPSVNVKVGPPSNATYSRPSSWNVALSSLPLGIGPPSLSTRCMLTIFEFGKTET